MAVQIVILANSLAPGHGSRVAIVGCAVVHVAKRVQVTERPASSQCGGVQCGQGNFILAEHRFLYEGIEEKCPGCVV